MPPRTLDYSQARLWRARSSTREFALSACACTACCASAYEARGVVAPRSAMGHRNGGAAAEHQRHRHQFHIHPRASLPPPQLSAMCELADTRCRYAGWLGTVAARFPTATDNKEQLSPPPTIATSAERLAVVAGTSSCHLINVSPSRIVMHTQSF